MRRSTASCGSSGPAPHGPISRTGIPPIKRATGGFSNRCARVCRGILEVLAQALHDEGYLDLQETFIDGSFAPAKQGGADVGKTKRGKGSKIMAIADRRGLPVAVHIESATPHEVTLVHATLAQRFVKPFPVRLIGHNAYESDRLDADLARRGVELIAPHRRTRTSRTQDGRPSAATDGGGRSSDSLSGSRTSGGSLSATRDTPRIFLRCYTSPAA